jgi:hypothetical protein
MKNLIFIILFLSFGLNAQVRLDLSNTFQDATAMPFEVHDNALAMNIEYKQLPNIRSKISEKVDSELKFFTGWSERGEGHITVITPPEFINVLSKYISIEDMNQIAKRNHIQKSDLRTLGLGSATRLVGDREEMTFFFIMDSLNLRKIRHKIQELFVHRGGGVSDFDPSWYFPHVTVGFTLKDLHENNGVIKSIKHSFDERFITNLITQ